MGRCQVAARSGRPPKLLGRFDPVLEQNPGYIAGSALSYTDLAMFQLIEGLRYAFPKAIKKRAERKVAALVVRRAESERRIPFNDMRLFRRCPELGR